MRPNISVQRVFQTNFDLCLRPRLTNAASAQLATLLSCLQVLQLDDLPDHRLMKLTGKKYTAKDAYNALNNGQGEIDVHGQRIWGSRVPNKVKIFAWLYFKDRLSTRTNLYAKHILDTERCERCSMDDEDRHHVFFGCCMVQTWPRARRRSGRRRRLERRGASDHGREAVAVHPPNNSLVTLGCQER